MNFVRAVNTLLSENPTWRLRILIHNAAVMLAPRRVFNLANNCQADEHAVVNFLHPLLLTKLLLPQLRQEGGRVPIVVHLASVVHGCAPLDMAHLKSAGGLKSYNPARAYAQSKLCAVMAARWLSRKCPDICFVAVNPGVVNTRLYRHTVLVSSVQPLLGSLLLRSPELAGTTVATVVDLPGIERTSGSYFEDGAPVAPARHANDDSALRELMAWAHEALAIDEKQWESA